jgi:hypothetical protein
VWQTGFDECGPELQYNSQPYSELSVAAFCWYKVLIGTIRGKIWSLFNTERRISETETREGRGGREMKDRNVGERTGTELTPYHSCCNTERSNEI